MSKGLESFKRIERHLDYIDEFYNVEYGDDLNNIEKELKTLEIIKKKKICIDDVLESVDYKQYCIWFVQDKGTYPERKKASEQEYDLLKEVLL